MDRNTVIGLTLIFILFIVWQQLIGPTPEEMEAQQRLQDSLAQVEQLAEQESITTDIANSNTAVAVDSASATVNSDSLQNLRLVGEFGPFAGAATGTEEEFTLENDKLIATFTNQGGRIKSIELKNYLKVAEDEKSNEIKSPLILLEDEKNKFEYFLPIASLPSGGVKTGDLFFKATLSDDKITFRADAGEGRYFEQVYTVQPASFQIDYAITFEGLNKVIAQNVETIQLDWLNYLDRLEKNTQYERNYSTLYYKAVDDDTNYCSCTSDDTEDVDNEPLKWVSHANQFFNTSLIAKESFQSGNLETTMLELEDTDLKKLRTVLQIPYQRGSSETFEMTFYAGPNEFEELKAMGYELEYIIPFGWSIFGTINRWIIRPLFNFLSGFIGSKGIVILVLTILVKLLLFPLTFRMLYSQSKMSALKPQIENMKKRFKDDQQQVQMETMKIYREFGVNPLGGCLPMVFQMPIWFALYRFFPASIEFRQASFLWATDLSSYDVFFRLPFEIPFGFGDHLSLFTLLWAITTLIYTYYNTRHVDMSAQPAMKYMQYIMPIFFLGFFNSFASGLTCYLLFSNLFNITQTLVTKNYLINNDKVLAELEKNKKNNKGKKKGGFQQRLEAALKEQQKVQAEREATKKKKAKK